MDITKYFIRESGGIHVNLDENDEHILCMLTRKNNNVEISNLEAGTMETLSKKITYSTATNLVITGKGVLTKSLKDTSGDSADETVINSLFPNIEPSNIYYSICRTSTSIYASIVKRDIVDSLIEKFHSFNIFFSSIYLGPLTASFLAPVMEKNKKITLGPNVFSFDLSNEITLHPDKALPEDIKIGGEVLKPSYHLSYAAALGFFIPYPSFRTGVTENLKKSSTLFYHKLFYQKALMPSLTVFLVLALLNYVFFFLQQTKNEELLAIYNVEESEIQNIDFYTEEIKKNTVLLRSLNLEDQQIYSFFLDRLAAIRPTGITWKTIEINPVKEENSSFTITGKTIIITGNATEAATLNTWINEIKTFSWVEKINKQNYVYDLRNNIGDFELELIYNLSLD